MSKEKPVVGWTHGAVMTKKEQSKTRRATVTHESSGFPAGCPSPRTLCPKCLIRKSLQTYAVEMKGIGV